MKEYTTQIVRDRIEMICNQKKVKPTTAAKESGAGQSAVANLKRGSMLASDSLAKLADYLDCSVDYLLGRIDEPTPKADSSIHAGNISGDNNSSTGNNFNIGTKTSAVGEQQQEISEMLSDMSPRERNKLMSMIYDFHDECKKGNEECDHI